MTIRNHPGYSAALAYMSNTHVRKTAPQLRYQSSKAVCDTGYLLSTTPAFNYNRYLYDGRSVALSARNGRGLNHFLAVGSRVCHGAFGQNFGSLFRNDNRSGVQVDYAVSALWLGYANRVAKAKAWWDFMFDPASSPWRKLIENGVLELHGENDIDPSLPKWLSLKITNETPTQLLMSFMMASRVPFEHVTHLDTWYTYVSNGVHPVLAIMLTQFGQDVTFNKGNGTFHSTSTGVSEYSQYAFSVPGGGDQSFADMFKNMAQGTPHLNPESTPYGAYGYGPVNCIWFAPLVTQLSSIYYNGLNTDLARFMQSFAPDVVASCVAKKPVAKDGKPRKAHFFQGTSAFLAAVRNTRGRTQAVPTSVTLSLEKLIAYEKEVLSGATSKAA